MSWVYFSRFGLKFDFQVTNMIFLYKQRYFFLSVIWLSFDWLLPIIEGDSLTQQMVINVLFKFYPKGHWKPITGLGPKA